MQQGAGIVAQPGEFRRYLASVDPVSLTAHDRLALLELLRACYAAQDDATAERDSA